MFHLDPLKIIIEDYTWLKGKEVKAKDKWINTERILAVSNMFTAKDINNEVVIFCWDVTNTAIANEEDFNLKCFLKGSQVLESPKKLFYPINLGNSHWDLVYVNFKNKEFAYIDLAHVHEDANLFKKNIKKFNKFIEVIPKWWPYVNTKEWKVKEYVFIIFKTSQLTP